MRRRRMRSKSGNVARDHAQAIVEAAQHVLDGLHLGDGAGGAFEIFQCGAAAGGQADAQKDADGEAQRGAVHDDAASGEDAGIGQAADAPPCGGLGQADRATDFRGAQRRVAREQAQDAPDRCRRRS